MSKIHIDITIEEKTKNDILSLPDGQNKLSIISNNIKELLKNYRISKEIKNTEQNKSSEIKFLEQLSGNVLDLNKQLETLQFRESVAYIHDECHHRHSIDFTNFNYQICNNLIALNSLINVALGNVDKWNQPRGEKTKTLEKKLLAKVAFIIEKNTNYRKIDAAMKAAETLTLNKVHNIPSTAPEARRKVLEAIEEYGEDYFKS